MFDCVDEQSVKQLNLVEPSLFIPDLKFGIPIPPPLTTEKGTVTIGDTVTELVERTRNV